MHGMWFSVWILVFTAHVARGEHYPGPQSAVLTQNDPVGPAFAKEDHDGGEKSSGSGFYSGDLSITPVENGSGSGSGSGTLEGKSHSEHAHDDQDSWKSLDFFDLRSDSVFPITEKMSSNGYRGEEISSSETTFSLLFKGVPERISDEAFRHKRYHTEGNRLWNKNFSNSNSVETTEDVTTLSNLLRFDDLGSHMNAENKLQYLETGENIDERNGEEEHGKNSKQIDIDVRVLMGEYDEEYQQDVSGGESSSVPEFEPLDSSFEKFTMSLNLRKPSSSKPDIVLESILYDYMQEEPELGNLDSESNNILFETRTVASEDQIQLSQKKFSKKEELEGREKSNEEHINLLRTTDETIEKLSQATEKPSSNKAGDGRKHSNDIIKTDETLVPFYTEDGSPTSIPDVSSQSILYHHSETSQDAAFLKKGTEVDSHSLLDARFTHPSVQDPPIKRASKKPTKNIFGKAEVVSPTLKFFQEHTPAISISLAVFTMLIVSAYIAVVRKKKAERRKRFQSLAQSKQDHLNMTPYGMPVIREEEAIRLRTRSSGV